MIFTWGSIQFQLSNFGMGFVHMSFPYPYSLVLPSPTNFLGPGLGLSPIPTLLEVGTHKIGEFPSGRYSCTCDPSCKMSDSPSQPQELDIDEVARRRHYSNPFVFSNLSNRN